MLFTEHSRSGSWPHRILSLHAKAAGKLQGGDRDVRGTALWGCLADNAKREPERPAKADLCAVKRKILQSPLQVARHGARARRKSRRDAGNTRGASTRSRRSGKQTSVGTHFSRAPRTVARQVEKGRDSPSQTVDPLIRTMAANPREEIGSEGQSWNLPKVGTTAAEALGNRR